MDGNLREILERANQVASNTRLDLLAGQMLSLIIEICQAEAGIVYLIDASESALSVEATQGRLPDNHLAEQAVQRLAMVMDESQRLLAFPIHSGQKPLGAVVVYASRPPEHEQVDLICDRLATDIDKLCMLRASGMRAERLEALINMIGRIGASLDRDQILRMIIENARSLLFAEATSLFLVDEETGELVLTLASNIQDGVKVEQLRMPSGKGIIGHAIEHGETLLVTDASQDNRHYTKVDEHSGFNTRALLAVPLKTRMIELGGELGSTQERIIGGLEAINKIGGTFGQEDIQLLETFASQAATVLQVATLYSEANELFWDVIKALTAAIDAKDPYTEGHSQRVCDYSVAIAQEMGLAPDAIQRLRIGSLFHDVGKIGIPDAILLKPGTLDEEEYQVMKQHPLIGANILSQVHKLQADLPPMAQHHERMDGSGYPLGLQGDEIPTISRIVAVADVFDAMTSDRPYRKALPIEQVFAQLQRDADHFYEGKCVEALISAYRQGRIQTQAERKLSV